MWSDDRAVRHPHVFIAIGAGEEVVRMVVMQPVQRSLGFSS
jgi:hypothetical protein